MDSTATNFNADATIDDNACIYPNVPVLGYEGMILGYIVLWYALSIMKSRLH